MPAKFERLGREFCNQVRRVFIRPINCKANSAKRSLTVGSVGIKSFATNAA